jgi:hypothetical protein
VSQLRFAASFNAPMPPMDSSDRSARSIARRPRRRTREPVDGRPNHNSDACGGARAPSEPRGASSLPRCSRRCARIRSITSGLDARNHSVPPSPRTSASTNGGARGRAVRSLAMASPCRRRIEPRFHRISRLAIEFSRVRGPELRSRSVRNSCFLGDVARMVAADS